MEYKEIKPFKSLEPYIHSYWKLQGGQNESKWERIFPDGCTGLVVNLGDRCLTDNGAVTLDFSKTYMTGVMTTFKDTFIDGNTHLFGVCLKPGAFSDFFNFAPQRELLDQTIPFESKHSFDPDRLIKDPGDYLNNFFADRLRNTNEPLRTVIQEIHQTKGRLGIARIAGNNSMSIRKLERKFKTVIGVSPKEYSKIVRFQNTLNTIKNTADKKSLLEIAFDCGYYDHSHLTNEIKRHTGLLPSQL